MKHFSSLTCTFTGHRPEKLPWGNNEQDPRCEELKGKIYDAVEAVYLAGIRHYICGMAKGCDTYFGEAVVRLRLEHSDVTLEAAIPCETQVRGWSEEDKRRYYRLAAQCDEQTVLQAEYTPDCMIKRNIYMVDHASILIAVYSGSSGGTRQTVNYARRQGLEVIKIEP